MRNAKEELLEILSNDTDKIKCANITHGQGWGNSEEDEFKLPVQHTDFELTSFIESLDFKYDAGVGGQELFGIVWLKDGTWLSRGEYDGSEWWEHNVLPEIPKELL
jgi:hypothetical protein